MFEHINTLTLRVVFTAEGKGELPLYLGSTLRGIMGHCIREFVCTRPNVQCHKCELSPDCAYAKNFCSPGNEAGAVNPYVIHSLTRDKLRWEPQDECQFDITLIGDATEHAGLFIDALLDMENKGWGSARLPFRLQQIIDPERQALIWSSSKLWMRNCLPRPLSCEQRRAHTAVVRFDSPVRILVSKQLRRQLTFAEMIHSLTRRIALLSHAYTGHILQWDEQAMLNEANKIRTVAADWKQVDFERYSMTRGGKLPLPAIKGWAQYEGDLTPFTPILKAGEQLHIGKNATIGFGHYQVNYN
ncbi:CRISPR system precrRNA processing endoribonuclease RAMP protein Cas6 [Paenibacillus terrae]|uniref:CRISPR-associated protein Cas6 C-terminal domain-containing protein n=1 Tax=Paenibacillus terrae TaxID=159743 RepID=A0A0D7WWH8_9BACL|nr:CRISPR system precrRNA processing endoribonuclease RAMP protein Cas6 [Paenibacillus terrae]KJD43088.1 hypothetical protein QD47_24575 [Paenibacillus terrae]